jgi:hypothetical protein
MSGGGGSWLTSSQNRSKPEGERTSPAWREPSDPALDFLFAFEDVQGFIFLVVSVQERKRSITARVAVANLPHAALDCGSWNRCGWTCGCLALRRGQMFATWQGRRVFGAPQNSTFYAGWPDWPCPLDGQADAEMFGLDSSSPSKHKMAWWCNSRPRPGLSVTQEGPESSRKTRRVTRHFSRRP